MPNALPSFLLWIGPVLFCIGLVVVLTKSNTLFILIGIELMLNAGSWNFILFSHYDPNPVQGHAFVLLIIAMTVCETALALALMYKVYQHYGTIVFDQLS